MSKVVHFEIPVDDPDRASAFYRDALGWEVAGFGEERYWLVRAGGDDEVGANGALIGRGELHAVPVVIVAVESIDDALRRVQEAGGQVLRGKAHLPGIGWPAYVRDSEGNTIGLFQPETGRSAG